MRDGKQKIWNLARQILDLELLRPRPHLHGSHVQPQRGEVLVQAEPVMKVEHQEIEGAQAKESLPDTAVPL